MKALRLGSYSILSTVPILSNVFLLKLIILYFFLWPPDLCLIVILPVLLVDNAKQQLKVVRLKGGDPFVFGRGGEEVERLVEEKISFRLIPGVTSGIAGPEYAGIPVTHRDVNHAVSFVTGHLAGSGKTELLDWESISKATPVIVVYMAMKKIDIIAEKLMQAGRSPEEPVAIITQATTPQQQVLTTTLRMAASEAKNAGLEPPSIIVFGAVASYAERLTWFGSA